MRRILLLPSTPPPLLSLPLLLLLSSVPFSSAPRPLQRRCATHGTHVTRHTSHVTRHTSHLLGADFALLPLAAAKGMLQPPPARGPDTSRTFRSCQEYSSLASIHWPRHARAAKVCCSCALISLQANQVIARRHHNFDRMEEAEKRRLGKDSQQHHQQEREHTPAFSPLPPLAFRFMIPDWLRQFSQSMAARLLPRAFVNRR